MAEVNESSWYIWAPHVTVIVRDVERRSILPQPLGLRIVKQTVNEDDAARATVFSVTRRDGRHLVTVSSNQSSRGPVGRGSTHIRSPGRLRGGARRLATTT